LIGSAAGRKVTLKFDAATDTVMPRVVGGETLINTVAELAFVRQDLAGKYKLESDIDLAVDGTVGSPAVPLEWEPIGNPGTNFTGTFDGDGHTIGNLKISSGSNVGFIGMTNIGCVIKNLGVSGNVSGTTDVGGVVAQAVGLITACSFDGTVTGSSNYVGGITGYIRSQGATITACRSTGEVKGTTSVGGLVGNLTNASSKIAACYSTATVTGTGGSIWGSNAGGTVSDCFTNGTAQTGVTVFGDGTGGTGWPAAGTAGWGEGNDESTGLYWKPLGSWNAANPVYPKLWWD
jgi:hypothetical protein